MTGWHLPLVFGMALAVGACAQQPPKDSPKVAAQAARWGVSPYLLVTAENRGYRPQKRHGKTYFCRSAAVTGSEIATEECLDAGLIPARLGREQDEQRRSEEALQNNHGVCMPGGAVSC